MFLNSFCSRNFHIILGNNVFTQPFYIDIGGINTKLQSSSDWSWEDKETKEACFQCPAFQNRGKLIWHPRNIIVERTACQTDWRAELFQLENEIQNLQVPYQSTMQFGTLSWTSKTHWHPLSQHGKRKFPTGAPKSLGDLAKFPGSTEVWECLPFQSCRSPLECKWKKLLPNNSNDPENLRRCAGEEVGESLRVLLMNRRNRQQKGWVIHRICMTNSFQKSVRQEFDENSVISPKSCTNWGPTAPGWESGCWQNFNREIKWFSNWLHEWMN